MPNSRKKEQNEPKMKFNLKAKMIAYISLLIVSIFVVFTLFLHSFISDMVEDQIGNRALSVAKSVANIPEVREAFDLEEPASVIQNIVAPIQQDIDAEFIVVGNTESIRYSHPDPTAIGERMVGEDNDRALLQGESYVSTAEGSLGLSIRGKTPIYDGDGEIIGLVSVGFLNDDIETMISELTNSLWWVVSLVVLIGIVGAVFIAHFIKKLLSNMEPEEISRLVIQQEAILQSTHEGIIAIDNHGLITMMNTNAQQLLFKEQMNGEDYKNKRLHDVIPRLHVMDENERPHDKEIVVGKDVMLVNETPMFSNGEIVGRVLTFRDKTELEQVTHELSRVKQYANAQRAQTHEFSNKLHTILGLLQLNQQEEAIEFIKKNSKMRQNWERSLTERIEEPMIHAILQGKFNQANELGVNITVHPDSQLSFRFSEEEKDVLLTVLGNTIENAIEAVKNQAPNKRHVSILFTDIGEDIIIEVEDSGPGIAKKDVPHIFEQGFSTKKGNHRGIGLALSHQAIQRIGGEMMLEEGDMGGACFVIMLPKKGDPTND